MDNITRYLEEELQEALFSLRLGNKADRNAEIVTKYLGFDGLGGRKGGFSMAEVGRPWGLTREMVRQITNKISHQGPTTSNVLPKLKKCSEIIDQMLPCEARIIEKAITDAGLTREGFRIEGIVNAFEMFGIKTSVHSIVEHKRGRFVISSEKQEKWAAEIMSKAGSKVSHNGAVDIASLAKELTSKKDTKIKTETAIKFVKGVVSSREEDDLCWISDDETWLYFKEVKRNRVITRVNKIFSIVKSCRISNILSGIERSFRKDKGDNYVIMPAEVLVKLLESTGMYEVSGQGVVECKVEFNQEELLKEFEILIIDEIKKSTTGIVSEGELEKAIVYRDGATEEQAKTNKYGFSVALNFSPVIVKINNQRGKYGLIGSD